jgi:molecular chaperone GrpE
MTGINDIIRDGTDGLGEASAGSRNFSGRTTSDPAEAETVSGSTDRSPLTSSGVGGDDQSSTPSPDGAATGDYSSSAEPAGEQPPGTRPVQDLAGGASPSEPLRNAGNGDVTDEADGIVHPIGDDSNGPTDGEEVTEDLDELSAALAERDEFKDLALRAKADFENYRKRADKRVAETRGVAVAGVIRELMPVVDNLDRAVDASASTAAGDVFVDGIRLVHADLHSVLSRLGLTVIEPEQGAEFDPNFHEAISQAPIEGAASNSIVEVVQKGFSLGEIVVRPARVVVAA